LQLMGEAHAFLDSPCGAARAVRGNKNPTYAL
jgi:hypothetical protein